MQLTKIAKILVNGGNIVRSHNYTYRIRDHNQNPIAKLRSNFGYRLVRDYLKNENGFFVIDEVKINKLSGRYIFKRLLVKQNRK
jgi:hypothetical protein